MRAMTLRRTGPPETHPLEMSDLEVPAIREDEILARVDACGVCRTDLHIVEGDLAHPKRRLVPGHEIVGTVVEVGKRVSRFAKGDRVGIPWLRSTCGRCEYCIAGAENLCPEKRFTGYTDDGGYGEFVVGKEAFALDLTGGKDKRGGLRGAAEAICPLLCAGIIGYRALKLALPRPAGRIALFGFGGSAHLTLQVAVKMGFETVVVSRSKNHLALAKRLGASETRLAGGDASLAKEGKKLGREATEEPVDSAIVFAPSGVVVRDALTSLKRGGTVAVAGIYLSRLPEMDYEENLFHEKRLLSVEANTRADAQEFLKLADSLGIRSVVSVRPLSSANEALSELKKGEVDGALVLKP